MLGCTLYSLHINLSRSKPNSVFLSYTSALKTETLNNHAHSQSKKEHYIRLCSMKFRIGADTRVLTHSLGDSVHIEFNPATHKKAFCL